MTYSLKFSTSNTVPQPGTGGAVADLKTVYEEEVWYDTAEVQYLGVTVSSVTVSSFTVSMSDITGLSCVFDEGVLIFTGVHRSAFNENYWTSRDNETTTAATVTKGTNWPDVYYAGYRYQPDNLQYTSVTWTVVTDLGTFLATQLIKNNWNVKREFIQTFVFQGTGETVNGTSATRYAKINQSTPLSAASFAVTNTNTAALITATFDSAPGLSPGEVIVVDVTSTAINHSLAEGTFNVVAVTSNNIITYYASGYGVLQSSSTTEAQAVIEDISYTTPGTYFFTATTIMVGTNLSIVGVGAGGGSAGSGSNYAGGGGGGGALGWINGITLQELDVITIVVGAAGTGGANHTTAGTSGSSTVISLTRYVGDISSTQVLLTARGGVGGRPGTAPTNAAGGTYTTSSSFGTYGGGNGGTGGAGGLGDNGGGAGGGGAGGYAGNGGKGAKGQLGYFVYPISAPSTYVAGTAGSGGGGAGGGNNFTVGSTAGATGGGGVNIFGQENSGFIVNGNPTYGGGGAGGPGPGWYPVTNAGWNTFLNTYGVWNGGASDVATRSFSVRLYFPVDGAYAFSFNADNIITFNVDGGTAYSHNGSTTTSNVTKSIGAGYHTVNVSIQNTGGPAAGALVITKPDGSAFWNTRTQPTDGKNAAAGRTGGTYGGGGGSTDEDVVSVGAAGGKGAARLIIGQSRSFPLNAFYATPATGVSSVTTLLPLLGNISKYSY